MSAEKVIQIAREELGYTEFPAGSNRTKYWEVYDPRMQGQPWCVSFLWWCFDRAGERMAFFVAASLAAAISAVWNILLEAMQGKGGGG